MSKEKEIAEGMNSEEGKLSESEKIVEETLREIVDEISNSNEEDESKSEENAEHVTEEEKPIEENSENAEEAIEKTEEDTKGNDTSVDDSLSDNESEPRAKRKRKSKKKSKAKEVDKEASAKAKAEALAKAQAEEIDAAKAKAEEAMTKHRKRKKAAITVAAIFGVIILAYLGTAFFFSSHFYPLTTINGVSQSMKTVDSVEEYLTQHVKDFSLTLQKIDNTTETIVGSDISLSYKKSDELKELLKAQNPFLWPKAFFEKPEITASVGVEYDKGKLTEKMNGLACKKAENQVASVSAYPAFNGEEFVVSPEVIGSQLNEEAFHAAVEDHINGLNETLDMKQSECYLKPQFVSDSEEVINAVATMNSYLGASITYDLNPQTEVVDRARIAEWVIVNEAMEVTFNEEGVRAYVADLASRFNTVGKTRTMTSANGNPVEVVGGDFGWLINQDEEYAALLANIQAAEVITREPIYKQRGASHGEGNDYGSTYIEVDLSNQHLWVFRDGQLIMESGVVTGNPNRGNGTPQGSYQLTYKTRNATLRGRRDANGVPEYETPVSFWMPFNGGIGFHDATWQSSFGGDRYLSRGSHGCVNMPYSKAEELYGIINEEIPIILHY